MPLPHRLALLLALSLGVAGAQNTPSDGTLANTKIENTAIATFTDPLSTSGASTSATSNTVVTTVLPRPGFDIVYRDGTDGLMNGTVSAGNTAATAKVTATRLAGETLVTPYTVVNNGNLAQTITLKADTSGSSSAPTVVYYADTDRDGLLSAAEQSAGAITSISLPYDDPATPTDEGLAYFIQVLTVPTAATANETYAASPVGSGQGFDTQASQPVAQTESATVLGLQFATATVLPPPSADLSILKTNNWVLDNASTPAKIVMNPDPSTDYVASGKYSRYYIRVTNNGPSAVTGAILRDIPSGLDTSNFYVACNELNPGVCTTATTPTTAQLLAGYALPTLQPGQTYEIRITPKVIGPGPTVDNTATVTMPSGMVDPTPANNTSTDSDKFGYPPVAVTATNATLTNDMGPTLLSPGLSGSDQDGVVVSYRIDSLPSGGVLLLDGVPVKQNQIIPAADIGRLSFDPDPTSGADASNKYSFNYVAIDNDGLVSSSATYTIPVTRNLGPLACTTTVYGLFGTGPQNMQFIRAVYSDGSLGPAVARVPFADTATMAVSPDGSRIFTLGSDYVLRMYNTQTGVWTTTGTITDKLSNNPVRMTIDRNGVGYVSTSDRIWTFNAVTGGSLSTGKTITFTDTTGLSPAPYLLDSAGNVNGDFIADSDGNIYLMANPSGAGYMDIFRIQGATGSSPTATYAGRLRAPAALSSVNYTGLAALPDSGDSGGGSDIYAGSSAGRLMQLDLGALNATVLADSTSLISNDLGSCYYPVLRPVMNSTKTVSNVTTPGATSTKPGDVLEYTITIHNSGSIAASGVTFQDTLPAEVTYVAGSTTMNGTAVADDPNAAFPYSTPKLVRSAGSDVANGLDLVGTDKDVIIKFRVTVKEGAQTISNQGVVGFTDNQTSLPVSTTLKTDDPKVSGTADPTVISAGAPVLGVTKTVDSRYVKATASTVDDTVTLAPEQLTYTLTVTNSGNAGATNVKVTDSLPAGVTYVSSSSEPALATPAVVSGQDLTFTIGNLAAGATQTIKVVVSVKLTANTAQTTISNQASTAGDGLAPVTSEKALTDIVYPKLRKSVSNLTRGTGPADKADGLPGDVLEYCLNFFNYSSVALPGYVLSDHVPGNTVALPTAYDAAGSGTGLGVKLTRGAAVSYLTSAEDSDTAALTVSGGAYGQGTLSINLGSLAAGESGSTCFQVRIR